MMSLVTLAFYESEVAVILYPGFNRQRDCLGVRNRGIASHSTAFVDRRCIRTHHHFSFNLLYRQITD
jgi:hypothetical protein